VQRGTVWREIPFALLAVVVLAVLANDIAIDGLTASVLSRSDGIVLLSFFIIFLYYIFGLTKRESANTDSATVTAEAQFTMLRSSVMVLAGIAGLVVGGKWIVDGAVAFATSFGVSEALIGLTIVAIGTSLPEMATSVVAAYKKNVDIAVGNIIGSNIFNIFWILGVSSLIRPLPFAPALTMDLFVTVGATLVLFLALFVGKRNTIERSQGIFFVLLYVAYTFFLIIRG